MASPIKILRQFTSLPAQREHQEEFDKQINAKADDRGVCLLIVAQLENELDRALDYELNPVDNIRSALFEPDGPLGTFARKITMAAALEIVGPKSPRDAATYQDHGERSALDVVAGRAGMIT